MSKLTSTIRESGSALKAAINAFLNTETTEKAGKHAVSRMKTLKNSFGKMFSRANLITSVVLLTLVILASTMVASLQMSYAITIDGETLVSGSKEELSDIVQNVEEKASDILGYEYSLDTASISIDTSISSQPVEDPEAIEDFLLSTVDGMTKLYVLTVDDVIVGAFENEDDVNQLLADIMDRYYTPEATGISFAQDVSVEYTYVSSDVLTDIDAIAKLLDPKSSSSPYALTVVVTETCEYTQAVEFESYTVEDETLYEGDTKVIREGIDGTSVITEQIYYTNSIETQSVIVSESVIQEPVSEIIAVGTKERPLTASHGTYIWPASGTITSSFGGRDVAVGSSNHKGLDIGASYGTAIYAADGGEVIYSGWMNGFGYLVQIRHDNGDVTYYAHCSSLLVSVGERVAQGQQIARIGSTGVSSGNHLHFEIRINGTSVNPLNYLD